MEKIMAVNAGSSSLKFQLLEMPEEKVLTEGVFERIGLEDGIFTIKVNGEKKTQTPVLKDHSVAVEMLLEALIDFNIVSSLDEISGVGHRVVHGGEKFNDSVLITEEVLNIITELSDLAPLHNPANIVGIKAFKKALPNVPAVAVFDTAFHQTMPSEAYMYSTPYEWYSDYGVRKYGFHGTSHKYVSERIADILGNKEANVIVCHLGNGGSLCAVQAGKSVDTTMGFTPLAGITMGTRSGDIDPAIIPYIKDKTEQSADDIVNALNKKSGLLGISGRSNDWRDVVNGASEGDERSLLAQNIFAYRIAQYIGSYHVALGGADAIAFTAGIGENSNVARKLVTDRLSALGIEIDEDKNNERGGEMEISTPNSKIKVFVIPTNEEVMIARDAVRLGKK